MNNTDVWGREGAYGTEDDPGAVSTWRWQGNTLSFPPIQSTDTASTSSLSATVWMPAGSEITSPVPIGQNQ